MMFARSFKMAISSLMASKLRALLTMLGIIIGVGAVIIIVALVGGFAASMTDTFESMGTNTVTASIFHPFYYASVQEEDVYEFVEENSDIIKYVSPTVSYSGTLKYGDVSLTSTGTGVSEDYVYIQDYAMSYGTGINYINVLNYEKVVVLGSYNATELFGNISSAVGEYIKINGERYQVIGVIEERASSEEGSSDDMFLIPYSIATRLGRVPIPTSYSFASETSDTALEAKDLIDAFYTEQIGSEDYHSIFSMEEMLEEINELTTMLTTILGGIASISLLVGGIGIMNIMIVSVTERTREIGIRKSLGGKRRHILTQFLIESAVTSSCGGIIGIGFGIGTSYIIGAFLDLTPEITAFSVLGSFGVSVAIGIFFGYFPALNASKMNPIDALRYD